MKKNFLKNEKGFTIIETLVAITILMISIAGPLTIAQKSLMAAIHAKDQVTASFLAQELMEKIKNEKDAAVLSGDFVNWSNVSLFNANHDCPNGDCVLKQNSNGVYGTTGTIVSKFTRKVIATDVPATEQEVKITVTVSWSSGTILNTVTLEDFMFNVTL